MNLYEIEQAIMDAYESAINPETGEVIDENAFAAIDQLQMERDAKCENIACWIKDLLGDAEKIEAEAKNLTARAKYAKNKAERLKRYLGYALNGEKFKTPRCSVSYRKSESVDVDPNVLQDLDEKYLRFKDPEADKVKIKEALKSGEKIPGCKLVENLSMIIK